jgi:two-component system response regulator DesR
VQPEVALVDMLLGTESGAEVCEEIHQVSPDTRVLLISGAGIISPNVARAAGAAGFISKDWSAVDVVRAVRRVSQGQEVFAEAPLDSPLSEREQEVLSLIATGSTNKEIAVQLHLSPHTVKEHTSAIYRKLGVRNRAEATRQAQRLKILV